MKHIYILLFVLPLFVFGQDHYVKHYTSKNGELKREGSIKNGGGAL